MIIEEQRGKKCPKGHPISVGDLSCEECDHFKFRISDRVTQHGLQETDEFCELLTGVGKLG